MNNKIKGSRFFEAGGLVEIRLIREVRYLDPDAKLIYYANDEKSFKEIWNALKYIDALVYVRTGKENAPFIDSILIMLDGILYSYIESTGLYNTMIHNDDYLYATGKYYRGATN